MRKFCLFPFYDETFEPPFFMNISMLVQSPDGKKYEFILCSLLYVHSNIHLDLLYNC